MKNIDIVVSCYNEEKNIKPFYEECIKNFSKKYKYQLIFVNDGSIDNTKLEICNLKNKIKLPKNINIKIINFSKNFGHESAMLAGLDYSTGDMVIFMDVDLQHPISKISEIVEKMEKGADIVLMARLKNDDKNALGEFLSKSFYQIINKLCHTSFEINASDFFAINNKVAEFLKGNYREKVRFLRGIIQNIGFNKEVIHYAAKQRLNGESKYNFFKLYNLAKNTLYSYTNLPLVIGKIMGIVSIICGLIVLIYTLATRDGAPSGYATLVVLICFMFAILFFIIGVMGEYISIMMTEMKDRPNYIIEDIL